MVGCPPTPMADIARSAVVAHVNCPKWVKVPGTAKGSASVKFEKLSLELNVTEMVAVCAGNAVGSIDWKAIETSWL